MKDIFRENQSVRSAIDALSAEKHWDTDRFEKILLTLAPVGGLNSISTPPDSVDMSAWADTFDALWKPTDKSGNEHGQVIIADLRHKSLVFSHIVEGEHSRVVLPYEKHPGREREQTFVATLHTHRSDLDRGIQRAFSAEDFVSFLYNRSEQAMFILYAENQGLLLLKTSETNGRIGLVKDTRELEEKLRSSIDTLIVENSRDSAMPALTRVLAGNFAVCKEYALVLYRLAPGSFLFKRLDEIGRLYDQPVFPK